MHYEDRLKTSLTGKEMWVNIGHAEWFFREEVIYL